MATDFEVEEWDADFIDSLVKAEELAITTSATQTPPNHHHLPFSLPPPHPPRSHDAISYSPPSELSQRVHDTPAVVDRGHGLPRFPSSSVSIPLGPDTTEGQNIDGFKDKKEEQLKFISSNIDDKETENCHAKSNFLHYDGCVPDGHGIPPEYQKSRSSDEVPSFSLNRRREAVGVQTDYIGESDNLKFRNDDSFIARHHQKKLLGIWDMLDGEKSEKDLALKVFEACGTDLQVLSGYLSVSSPSNTTMESSISKSGGPFQESLQSAHSADAAKISHLFLMLTKISSEMVRLEDLLEALIDCCHLKNAVIVCGSLRIMHVVLKHAFRMRKKWTQRDNFVFTGPLSEHILADMHNQESFESGNLFYPWAKNIAESVDSQGAAWFKAKRNSIISIPPKVDWLSLFELMNQIVMANVDEHVQLEAISIMNTIVISCNAYSEREKFASELLFRTVSLVLRKEAGFCLRKQAVNLFYQLLNCPKVTTAFCFGCVEEDDRAVKAEVDATIISSVQEFRVIVIGLVDCLSCTGNCTEKLKLRRCTISVIAYIASLGKDGIEILLNHRLPQRSNILVSILESLTSDLDLETLDAVQSFEVLRERTLLIREALILLNRLVSHPQFSNDALKALTSGRDATSLTIDVAKRLCRKGKFLWQDDSTTKQIRESEIVELARLFKRRVFTFLGDDVS